MMEKLDLKKDQKHLYAPSAKAVALVEVPPMNFLMADGAGDPNTAPVFHEAVEALYSLAYTLKFMVKKVQGIDCAVLPLEGRWWAEDMQAFAPETQDKSRWLWTLLIRHHEIYLSDPRRTVPEKLKTILRQPVRKKSSF
jgi:hypothetical protein